MHGSRKIIPTQSLAVPAGISMPPAG